MKKLFLSLFVSGAILSAAPVNVSFVNAGNPEAAYGFYVGPYILNVNGTSMPAMCMDDFVEVSGTWSANVTPVNSSNLNNTYLGNGNVDILGNIFSSSQLYKMEAYLFSEIIQPNADRADIQEAAWTLMDINTASNVVDSNNNVVINILWDAYYNSPSADLSGFHIVSEAGLHKEQEFIVGAVPGAAPEPATFALFGAGLLVAGTARFYGRRKQAKAMLTAH